MSRDKILDMLIGHSKIAAAEERTAAIDKKNRDNALKKVSTANIISGMARAMAGTATPESLSDLRSELGLDHLTEPRHELLVYLDSRSKVNIQAEHPEYFCSSDVIKGHVLGGLVAFSANRNGCPYIWEVESNDGEAVVNNDIISRFDIIELAGPDLVVKKYRIVVIAYGQPTVDITFPDVDDAVRIFVNHLYITDELEDEL